MCEKYSILKYTKGMTLKSINVNIRLKVRLCGTNKMALTSNTQTIIINCNCSLKDRDQECEKAILEELLSMALSSFMPFVWNLVHFIQGGNISKCTFWYLFGNINFLLHCSHQHRTCDTHWSLLYTSYVHMCIVKPSDSVHCGFPVYEMTPLIHSSPEYTETQW